MVNLSSIMIGTMQPNELASFYEKVFDKPADMQDGSWSGWQLGSVLFTVGEHSEMAGSTKDPGRIIFNLETNEVKEEFERVKALGATIIKEPYEMQGGLICTFADPDGNYFQFVTPWE